MSWGTGLSAFAQSFAVGYQLKQSRLDSEKRRELMDTQNEVAKLQMEQSREMFPLNLEDARTRIDYNRALTTSTGDSNRRANEKHPLDMDQASATLEQTRQQTANLSDANRRANEMQPFAIDASIAGTESTRALTDEQAMKNDLTRSALPDDNGMSRRTNAALDATFGPGSRTYVPINAPSQYQSLFQQADAEIGVPGYTATLASIESSFDPNAKNASGAAGMFQFVPSTAKLYSLDDPHNPTQATAAMVELTKDNAATLERRLGRKPTGAELYLAHQQGAGGAARLLANPKARAIDIVGRDAVIKNGGNENMTAEQFAQKWMGEYDRRAGRAGTQAASPMSEAPPVDADQGQVALGVRIGLERLSGELLGNDVGAGFAVPPENADQAVQRLYLGDLAGEPELVTRILNTVDPEGFYPTGPRVNMAIGAIMANGDVPMQAKAEAVMNLLQSARMEAYRWATLADKAAKAGDIDGQMQAAIQAWNTIPDNEIVTAVDYDEKADRYMLTLRDISTGRDRKMPFLSPDEVAAGALQIQPEMFDQELARFVAMGEQQASGTGGGKGSGGSAVAVPVGPEFEAAARTGAIDPATLGALPENLQPEYREAATAGDKLLRGGMDGEDAVPVADQVVEDVVTNLTSNGAENMQGGAPTQPWSGMPQSGSLSGITTLLQDQRFRPVLRDLISSYLQRSDAVNTSVLTRLVSEALIPGQSTWEARQISDDAVLWSNRTTGEKVNLPMSLSRAIGNIVAQATSDEVENWSSRSKAGAEAIKTNRKAARIRRDAPAIDKTGRGVDMGILSGYREIQEMGPSSGPRKRALPIQ